MLSLSLCKLSEVQKQLKLRRTELLQLQQHISWYGICISRLRVGNRNCCSRYWKPRIYGGSSLVVVSHHSKCPRQGSSHTFSKNSQFQALCCCNNHIGFCDYHACCLPCDWACSRMAWASHHNWSVLLLSRHSSDDSVHGSMDYRPPRSNFGERVCKSWLEIETIRDRWQPIGWYAFEWGRNVEILGFRSQNEDVEKLSD